MSKKLLSSREVVKILCRDFGFQVIHQRGSHIKLQKRIFGEVITTIVPNHKEIARGTLGGILKLAQITKEEFFKNC